MGTKRRPRREAARASLHVTLPTELLRRLKAFAAWEGKDAGRIVERLVRDELKGFSVALRGGAGQGEGARTSSAGEDAA